MERPLIIPFFIPHAGCPFTCVFCDQWEISGASAITKPEEIKPKVLEYLAAYHGNAAISEIAFYGGSFTGIEQQLQNELLLAASQLKNEGIIQGIRLSTRPDYIDKEILDNLLAHGVTTVELGVQSLVDDVLQSSCRGYGVDEVVSAAQLIREYPFELIFQLMLGLPGDTKEYARLTAYKTIELAPNGVRIYPTLVMKNTTLAKWYLEGSYQPLELAEAVSIGAEWYTLFAANNIRIIRLGLQAADNLTPEADLVAGPYHPSYGELVQSRVMLKQLESVLTPIEDREDELQIYCNPRDLSKVSGQKKANLLYLKQQYRFSKISLKEEPQLNPLSLRLVINQSCWLISREEFLEKYRISVVK